MLASIDATIQYSISRKRFFEHFKSITLNCMGLFFPISGSDHQTKTFCFDTSPSAFQNIHHLLSLSTRFCQKWGQADSSFITIMTPRTSSRPYRWMFSRTMMTQGTSWPWSHLCSSSSLWGLEWCWQSWHWFLKMSSISYSRLESWKSN